jgi:hypothetical protein
MAAAAAFACALEPDFGAVLRAVLAGAFRLDAEAEDRFGAARLAGVLRAFEAAVRFAGDFRVRPPDFEDADLFLAAGFFLLGFLGVAMATHYS